MSLAVGGQLWDGAALGWLSSAVPPADHSAGLRSPHLAGTSTRW